MQFVRSALLSLASGVLLGLSFTPSVRPWFVLVACVPLWFEWMTHPKPGRVFLTGWLAVCAGTLISCPWTAYAARMYFSVSWIVAGLCSLAYSAIAYLYIPFAGLAWSMLRRTFRLDERASILLLPWILVLFELLFPMLLPSNLGYPWMWSGLPIIQLGDWIGFTGLSLLTFSLNALMLGALLHWRQKQVRGAAIRVALVLSIFCAANAIAFWHGKSWEATDRVARIFLVQPNHADMKRTRAWIGPGDLYKTYYLRHMTSMSRDLATADGKADLVLWPELSMPIRMDQPSAYSLKIRSVVNELGMPLLVGGESTDNLQRRFNTAAIFEPEVGVSGLYRKSRLMPFGEYVPGGDWIPEAWKGGRFEYTPGEDPAVRRIGGIQYGLTICFEGIIAGLVSGLARDGAQILVNISNDYWFGQSDALYQTHYMTSARVLETRRPLVRLGNVGITAVVLANGQVSVQGPAFQEWKRAVTVPYLAQPPLTLFTRWGWLWPWVTGLAVLAVCWLRRSPAPAQGA